MKLLVLGSNGQVGKCLNDQLKNTDYEVIFTSRDQIDVTDFKETQITVSKIRPDVIINATAYTAVDNAENDQDLADLINHLAVSNIAEICHQIDCWLIHLSTDYVFDGNSQKPYTEDDEPNPQGVYGITKLKGEISIKSSKCKYIIIRTSWVFSEYGNNFFKTMFKIGQKRDQLSIVSDQYGCPTYAQDIAMAIKNIISQLEKNEAKQGILNFCGDISCSWHKFAHEIFKALKVEGVKTPKNLISIKTSEFPTLAKRPKNSALCCKKILKDWGIVPSKWQSAIKDVARKVKSYDN